MRLLCPDIGPGPSPETSMPWNHEDSPRRVCGVGCTALPEVRPVPSMPEVRPAPSMPEARPRNQATRSAEMDVCAIAGCCHRCLQAFLIMHGHHAWAALGARLSRCRCIWEAGQRRSGHALRQPCGTHACMSGICPAPGKHYLATCNGARGRRMPPHQQRGPCSGRTVHQRVGGMWLSSHHHSWKQMAR